VGVAVCCDVSRSVAVRFVAGCFVTVCIFIMCLVAVYRSWLQCCACAIRGGDL